MRLILIGMLAASLAPAVFAESQLIDGVAVIVNDAVITVRDVNKRMEQAEDQLRRTMGNQPALLRQRLADLRKEATDQLVQRQLILQEFKANPIFVLPDSLVDDNLRDRIKQQYSDRATAAKSLRAENKTLEALRQEVRDKAILDRMIYFYVHKEVIISPQKIISYYESNKTNYMVPEQIRLRVIQLNKAIDDDGRTRRRADEILLTMKGGVPFEEMAATYSDGPFRATRGDAGWKEKADIGRYADIAFSLKKGEVSGVIDLPDVCYIVEPVDRRPAHEKPLAEIREEIERNLLELEQNRLQAKWISRLRAKAFVRYYPY